MIMAYAVIVHVVYFHFTFIQCTSVWTCVEVGGGSLDIEGEGMEEMEQEWLFG